MRPRSSRSGAHNAKRLLLALAEDGERAFAELDARSAKAVGAPLDRLDEGEQRELVEAMRTVERLLAEGGAEPNPRSGRDVSDRVPTA